MKPAYKVQQFQDGCCPPEIVKVEVDDLDGTSWRDAKKQLRKWFTDRAAAIRAMREPK